MATCAKCGTHFFQLYEDAGPLCPRCLATEVSLQPVRVTPILVGLIVVIYVAMIANGVSFSDPTTDALLAWGADFGPLTLRGQSWRLLTSMFLHAGFLHLAFNAWALWVLGRLTERLLGSVAFTLVYLLSGIGGNLLSLLINPLQVSVGASGAIFGAACSTGSRTPASTTAPTSEDCSRGSRSPLSYPYRLPRASRGRRAVPWLPSEWPPSCWPSAGRSSGARAPRSPSSGPP